MVLPPSAQFRWVKSHLGLFPLSSGLAGTKVSATAVGRMLSDLNWQGAANGGDGGARTGAACPPLRRGRFGSIPAWSAARLARQAADSSVSGQAEQPHPSPADYRRGLRTSQE